MKKLLSLLLTTLLVFSLIFTTGCDFGDQNTDVGADNVGNTSNENNEEVVTDAPDPERDEFIAGLGGVSDTFKGAVSDKSYSSSDEAAKAYVSVELVGSNEAKVNSVVSKGTLDSNGITKAGIPQDLIAGCDAVEELEVVYEVAAPIELNNDNGIVNLAKEKVNESYTVKVYVIKFGVDWKYFTPMPVTGDTISKSYYDSVFNAEKYKNCTLNVTSEVGVIISAQGETMNMTATTQQLIKHADGKVYMEQIITTSDGANSRENYVAAYMEEVDDGVKCYVKLKRDGDWYVGNFNSLGFDTLDELTPFYDQYLDYSYFTKTGYGFKLADENALSYFYQTLAGAFEQLGMASFTDDMGLDMYAEYYVADGVLSGMRVDAAVDLSMNMEGVTMVLHETVTTITKCTDYGTTEVECPVEEF